MTDNIEQVISESIAELPGNDGSELDVMDSGSEPELDASSDNESPEEGSTPSVEDAAEPVAEVQPAATPEDELAAELGLKPGQKNNRIPYTRVQAMRQKLLEKHTAELAERESSVRQQFAQFEAPEFQAAIQQSAQLLQLIEQNPEQFIERLAAADPRYAQLIQAQQQQQQAAQEQNFGIEPDVLMADGSLGYSPQAMQRLVDTRAADIERRIEQKFNQQFGPVVQDYRQAQMMRGAQQKAQTQLQSAQGWTGFEENRPEILKALQSDRSLSLEQAYIKIVGPKLASSRDDMRKQILAEINAKPRAAAGSVGPRPTTSAQSDGPIDTEDIIRQAIAGLDK